MAEALSFEGFWYVVTEADLIPAAEFSTEPITEDDPLVAAICVVDSDVSNLDLEAEFARFEQGLDSMIIAVALWDMEGAGITHLFRVSDVPLRRGFPKRTFIVASELIRCLRNHSARPTN